MRKLLLLVLSIFAMEISFAQTASDYFLPMEMNMDILAGISYIHT